MNIENYNDGDGVRGKLWPLPVWYAENCDSDDGGGFCSLIVTGQCLT